MEQEHIDGCPHADGQQRVAPPQAQRWDDEMARPEHKQAVERTEQPQKRRQRVCLRFVLLDEQHDKQRRHGKVDSRKADGQKLPP